MSTWSLATTVDASEGGTLVVVDGRAIALSKLVDDAPPTVADLLVTWDAWCDRISAAVAGADSSGWGALADLELAAPLLPSAIYACGANYYDHVEEMIAITGHGKVPDKEHERVFHFQISPAALTGHAHVVRRPVDCTMLDYEVELAAVIGRGGSDIDEAQALDHVAAYTVVNDVSLRDPAHQHPIFGANFLMAKSQTSMQPMGPTLVPARFVADPAALRLSMKVNGEIRQDGTTGTMIWGLAEQIAALSRMVTLRPGDVIMTGTPAGTSAAYGGYLADGDVMEAWVEGLGTLVNTVGRSA